MGRRGPSWNACALALIIHTVNTYVKCIVIPFRTMILIRLGTKNKNLFSLHPLACYAEKIVLAIYYYYYYYYYYCYCYCYCCCCCCCCCCCLRSLNSFKLSRGILLYLCTQAHGQVESELDILPIGCVSRSMCNVK